MTTSATPGQAASGGATGGPGQPAPSRGTRPARLLVYGVIALVVIVAAAAAALVVMGMLFLARPVGTAPLASRA